VSAHPYRREADARRLRAFGIRLVGVAVMMVSALAGAVLLGLLVRLLTRAFLLGWEWML
jgi:hypothetical protein